MQIEYTWDNRAGVIEGNIVTGGFRGTDSLGKSKRVQLLLVTSTNVLQEKGGKGLPTLCFALISRKNPPKIRRNSAVCPSHLRKFTQKSAKLGEFLTGNQEQLPKQKAGLTTFCTRLGWSARFSIFSPAFQCALWQSCSRRIHQAPECNR
ncbi:MAG: hypothetical protein DRO11_07130 [Methanobacteriota archaeon]|nr:MAG: hypothetical protein DRO11_07130 [Euryarchaeota archaeon]